MFVRIGLVKKLIQIINFNKHIDNGVGIFKIAR